MVLTLPNILAKFPYVNPNDLNPYEKTDFQGGFSLKQSISDLYKSFAEQNGKKVSEIYTTIMSEIAIGVLNNSETVSVEAYNVLQNALKAKEEQLKNLSEVLSDKEILTKSEFEQYKLQANELANLKAGSFATKSATQYATQHATQHATKAANEIAYIDAIAYRTIELFCIQLIDLGFTVNPKDFYAWIRPQI